SSSLRGRPVGRYSRTASWKVSLDGCWHSPPWRAMVLDRSRTFPFHSPKLREPGMPRPMLPKSHTKSAGGGAPHFTSRLRDPVYLKVGQQETDEK
ncbi:hypothetical protein, partial [Endozoicomonas sp. ONNA2]|uniref:hypothetical protein n=1 Tax=Endozoicomonas sp. ONNA2 TaxID=2828741 RepID=UPI00214733F3